MEEEIETQLSWALNLLTFHMLHNINSCMAALFSTVHLSIPDGHFYCQVVLLPELFIPFEDSLIQLFLLPFGCYLQQYGALL